MRQAYKIRFARRIDLPGLVDLVHLQGAPGLDPQKPGEGETPYLVAAEGGREIVGAAGFAFHSAALGEVTFLAVRPAWLGCGVGSALHRRCLDVLRGFGCDRVIARAVCPQEVSWYKRYFGYAEADDPSLVQPWARDGRIALAADLTRWPAACTQPSKLIINAALTGMVPRKKDNLFVPVTPAEIAADALRAAALGASIVHLHARGEDETPVPDPAVYAEIIVRIRERRPDLVLCVTTSGRNCGELEKRSAVLSLADDLRPDMASLTLGSMNFPGQASVNAPQTIQALARLMLERGIRPELEIFEAGMVDYTKYLFRKGFLELPLYCNLLLGSLGTMNASERNLRFLVEDLPPHTVWAAAGIGSSQFDVHRLAVGMGGGVRVGLEDNLYLDADKQKPARNEDLIRRVLDLAAAAGREIATPAEVREWLEL